MYGEYIDEDGRRQSYVLPSDPYPNSARNRHSSLFSSPSSTAKDWGSRSNERHPPSPNLSIRSPSPSDTANRPFPLNDVDYESDPVAVAQEISNLQALRRMSMDVTSTADPDLPSFNTFVPSTPPDDGGDPGSVFWVPARLHPELAPKEFSAYLETKKNEIRRPHDGSLSPDGPNSGGPGLRRKKSMLSRQIDHSEASKGYRDGSEVLVRGKSGKEGPSVQLEDLMSDPATLMRKLSVERKNEEGEGAGQGIFCVRSSSNRCFQQETCQYCLLHLVALLFDGQPGQPTGGAACVREKEYRPSKGYSRPLKPTLRVTLLLHHQ
jgi:hypothetical protein